MKLSFVKYLVVIALLSVQVSGSFASVAVPCASDMVHEIDNRIGHHMAHSTHDVSENCCNQDCCCPMAAFQLGMLAGANLETSKLLNTPVLTRQARLHKVLMHAVCDLMFEKLRALQQKMPCSTTQAIHSVPTTNTTN